jgi:hypothetical protein
MQALHQVRLEIQTRNNLEGAFVVSPAVMNSGTCLMFSLNFWRAGCCVTGEATSNDDSVANPKRLVYVPAADDKRLSGFISLQ